MRFVMIALFVRLGWAYEAMAQDAAQPYPKDGPIHQYIMADRISGIDESSLERKRIMRANYNIEWRSAIFSTWTQSAGWFLRGLMFPRGTDR
jgi:hypothetical protein